MHCELVNIDDKELQAVLTNRTLFKLIYGKSESINDYKSDPTFFYLLIKNNTEVVGAFQVKYFTKITLEAHIFILPKYWGGEISRDAVKAGKEWVKQNTKAKQILVTVPLNCIHVIKFLDRLSPEFRICGSLKNGIIYKNTLVDLILYQTEV